MNCSRRISVVRPSAAHLRHGRVWDVLTNPKIVAVVSDLLGPSVVAWGSHFFCKMPNDGKTVSWHQDASYWPLTPSKAVTVWLAIDDADRGNAAMKYIPGTHVLGHLTYKLSETDPSNVLNQAVPDVENYGEPVYVELKAGEASLHSDLLLHGSDANTSTRRRCGLRASPLRCWSHMPRSLPDRCCGTHAEARSGRGGPSSGSSPSWGTGYGAPRRTASRPAGSRRRKAAWNAAG